MTSLTVGQFADSTANNLGIGKVVEADGASLVIEYFVSPVADRILRRLAGARSGLVPR